MQKILLLSDTHGHLDDAILRHVQEADQVWHAGDLGSLELADKIASLRPFKAVYGNIDNSETRLVYPEDLIFETEGLKVAMTHIAGYPGTYSARAKNLITTHQPHVFICGHSHILKVMKDPKLGHLHINPGAAGVHGFHIYRTMIRFRIEDGRIIAPEVIELGKRGSLT